MYTWRKAKHIDKRNPSARQRARKDYYRKGSVEKVIDRASQGALRQDQMTNGKPPVVK
jgi:hypothetical protein